MKKILFVNACMRDGSRTLRLARHILSKTDGVVSEITVRTLELPYLSEEDIVRRNFLASEKRFDAPELALAVQFAEADTVLIAAPCWDMGFPAALKNYLEHITIIGVTFGYSPEGIAEGMCRAEKLIYVTTSGGKMAPDFGYSYIEAVSRGFYGIPETVCFKAENLDIAGNDPEKILAEAMKASL